MRVVRPAGQEVTSRHMHRVATSWRAQIALLGVRRQGRTAQSASLTWTKTIASSAAPPAQGCITWSALVSWNRPLRSSGSVADASLGVPASAAEMRRQLPPLLVPAESASLEGSDLR